ncbi:MAG: TolB family protein, partial [Gemmatimonadota bacterium]
WSPDGTRIAFLAPDDDDNTQVFVRWMDDEGAVSQVTRLTESPSDLAWSPDGTRIGFTMRRPAEEPTSAAWRIDLQKPEGAQWTPEPRIVESLIYRGDRRGFLDETFEQIFVVPADGGTPRQLTHGEFDHGSPAWTPDGRSLLFSGLLADDADYRWQESEIYRLDVESGEIEPLTTRKGPDGRPVPSPDGRWIAYVGHDTTTMDYIESALYVMAADGSNAHALTATLDRSPGDLHWAPDGRGIYFGLRADGYENVWFASLDGAVGQVTEGAHLLEVDDVSSGGIAVGVRSDADEPADLVAFPLARPERLTRLTRVNEDVLHGVELGEVEELWTESFDGLRIHGWIIKPPEFDPGRRYPMML